MKFIDLLEAIPLSKAKEYVYPVERREDLVRRLGELVDAGKVQPGTSKYRVVIPMGRMPYLARIEHLLEPAGYREIDLENGMAVDKDGRRVKVGKALERIARSNPAMRDEIRELVDLYAENRSRDYFNDLVGGDFSIVVSVHPYDIAGASTGRHWHSCLNIYDGEAASSIYELVDDAAMIAYLVRSDDLNIEDPLMRKLIYPYFNPMKDRYIYADTGLVYGGRSNDFEEAISRFLTDFNGTDWYCATIVNPVDYEEIEDTIYDRSRNPNELRVEDFAGDTEAMVDAAAGISVSSGIMLEPEMIEYIYENAASMRNRIDMLLSRYLLDYFGEHPYDLMSAPDRKKAVEMTRNIISKFTNKAALSHFAVNIDGRFDIREVEDLFPDRSEFLFHIVSSYKGGGPEMDRKAFDTVFRIVQEMVDRGEVIRPHHSQNMVFRLPLFLKKVIGSVKTERPRKMVEILLPEILNDNHYETLLKFLHKEGISLGQGPSNG